MKNQYHYYYVYCCWRWLLLLFCEWQKWCPNFLDKSSVFKQAVVMTNVNHCSKWKNSILNQAQFISYFSNLNKKKRSLLVLHLIRFCISTTNTIIDRYKHSEILKKNCEVQNQTFVHIFTSKEWRRKIISLSLLVRVNYMIHNKIWHSLIN